MLELKVLIVLTRNRLIQNTSYTCVVLLLDTIDGYLISLPNTAITAEDLPGQRQVYSNRSQVTTPDGTAYT